MTNRHFSSSGPALLEWLESRRLLSAGNLDTTFGIRGAVALDFSGDPLALLPAGGDKAIVVSDTGQVQRRNADGSLDTTFGSSGLATLPLKSVTHAGIGSGGKIILSGTADAGGVICRLSADGTLDSSFGVGGVADLSQKTGGVAPFTFALQPNGEIAFFSKGSGQFYRLSADGSHASFAITIPTGPFSLGAVAVQPDGKLLLGGQGLNADDNSDITLLRLNVDGSLDTTFANHGYFSAVAVQGIAVQSDGKIVIAADSSSGKLTVARLTSAGAIDSTFGNTVANGVHETQLSFGTTVTVLPASGGKVIVYDRSHLTRLNADGSVDSTFGRVQTFAYNAMGREGHRGPATQLDMDGVVLQSNGRLLIAGYDSASSPDARLYRLQSDSDPGGMFNLIGGTLSITGTDGSDWIQLETEQNLLGFCVRGSFGRVFDPGDVTRISAVTGADDDMVDLQGFSGAASVSGGEGSDTLIAGDGSESLSGNANNDAIYGGPGDDRLAGNGGRDRIRGGAGNNRIYGGGRGSWLWGGPGADTIWAGPGDDRISGGGGDNTIYAGDGNDTLDGGPGRDMLFGQDGNDTLFARDGRIDSLDGGAGLDRAQRDNSATIKDQILSIESFV